MADPGVVTALRELYASPEWLVLPEVRSGTGYREDVRYADALAINLWPSSSDRLIGFEFKVAATARAARADLLREITRPEKAATIGRFCSRWFYVVRAPWKLAVFSMDELPEGAGLIEIGTGKPVVVRESERRDAEPMSEALMLSLLRSASETAKDDWLATAPLRAVVKADRNTMLLSCGHEAPRGLTKKPPLRARCVACAAALVDAEGVLASVERGLSEAAEAYEEDAASAIIVAGGLAVDGVRASLRALARAS